MIKRLALLLVIFQCSAALAQTIKTDVLIIDGSPSGVAAAIQSARSKVKTLLIEKSPALCPEMTGTTMVTITVDDNLAAGIWGEFRKRVIGHYKKTKGYDTTYNAPLQFEPGNAATILTNIADSVKNLTIKLNTTFTFIKKDGDYWEVGIDQDGKTQTIKTRVIIDATENGDALQKAGASFTPFNIWNNTSGSKTYRTAIATGTEAARYNDDTIPPALNYPRYPGYCIPIKTFVAKGVDNLLVAGMVLPGISNLAYLPNQLTMGQGAGVIAAYCAFFKTTTQSLNVRVIQGELLDFKGYMLPLQDIATDPYWRAIQQVCATGMLKGVQKGDQLLFMPDSIVTTAEVKPVLLETYTRAFLWFNSERPGKQFTIGNLLSFISELTLTEPHNLQVSIRQDWKTKYGLKSDFDVNRPITRREFAILANKFLNPFARTVDLDGNMVN